MSRIHLWFGPNGTGKTGCALSGATPESPVGYSEWEPGGFKRGASGLGLNEGSVLVHKFRVPATELEQMGEVKTGASGNLQPQLAYKLSGWMEVIQEFTSAYMDDCKSGRRPVIDTATRLWLAERLAFDQQVQDATGKDAEKLGQLKYTAPNARMISIAEYAERYDLDLILIAHEDTVFNSNPPQPKADTMKELENLADVVLRFRIVNSLPCATIWKAADGGMQLKGMEIMEPSLEKVNLLLDCAAALRRAGVPMPDDAGQVISQGRMLNGA